MAAKTIEVLCPNARRQKVKVDGSMTILQILQQVCVKQGYRDTEYDLKHLKKVLDVTSMVRFLNLPNNAKLEMVQCIKPRKASKVTVALQLEDGQRIQKEFEPTTTIFDVLKQCESGEHSYARPDAVCVYMRHEYKGSSLQNTTLQCMGLISGKAVIRLLFRKLDEEASHKNDDSRNKREGSDKTTSSLSGSLEVSNVADQTNFDVNEPAEKKKKLVHMAPENSSSSKDTKTSPTSISASNYELDEPYHFPQPKTSLFSDIDQNVSPGKKDIERKPQEVDKLNENSKVLTEKNEFSDFKFPDASAEEEDDLAIDPIMIKREVELSMPCNRHPVLYRIDENMVRGDFQADEPEEGFFEVTVEDLRKRLNELKAEKQQEGGLLMTKKMRDKQELAKAMHYQKVPIRFFFPDKTVLQGIFRPLETVAALKNFVSEHLSDGNTKYILYTTPPKVILKEANLTLFKAKLVPAAKVYVSSSSNDLTIKQEYLEKIASYSDAEAAIYGAMDRDDDNVPSKSAVKSKTDTGLHTSTDTTSQSTSSDASTSRRPQTSSKPKGAPKWFKVGR